MTIFDCGHEIVPLAGLNWLSQQRKDLPAEWDVKDFVDIYLGTQEVEK